MRISRLINLLASIALLSGCTQPPEPQPPLKIGVCAFPSFARAFIAEQKGLFKKHGVNVELVFKPDYADIPPLYRKGQVDGLFSVLTDVIMFNAEGRPTKIVYVTDYSDTADLIVGRPELKGLSDLKGKTISFEGVNTFSHLFVVNMLDKAGVHEGQFKAMNLTTAKVLEALEAGRIDAGHSYEPFNTAILAKGYKVLAKAGDVPGIIMDVLAFDKNIVQTRPNDIQAVVNALVETKTFLDTHRQEAISIMAQAQNLSTTEVQAGLNTLHQLDVQENRVAMQPQGNMFKAGQDIVDFYLQRGQLMVVPELNDVIDNRFVQAVP
jgi:NitT/TauT family transport system substrate-binding protein